MKAKVVGKARAAVAPKRGGRAGGSALWLLGLACGAAAALLTPEAVLALLLLAPTLAAALLEREPRRPLARVTLLCGGATAIGPVVTLWQGGRGLAGALALASSPHTLAACWAAQAGGWLLGQIIPIGLRLLLDARAAATSARLQGRRRALEDEWGVPPREG